MAKDQDSITIRGQALHVKDAVDQLLKDGWCPDVGEMPTADGEVVVRLKRVLNFKRKS